MENKTLLKISKLLLLIGGLSLFQSLPPILFIAFTGAFTLMIFYLIIDLLLFLGVCCTTAGIITYIRAKKLVEEERKKISKDEQRNYLRILSHLGILLLLMSLFYAPAAYFTNVGDNVVYSIWVWNLVYSEPIFVCFVCPIPEMLYNYDLPTLIGSIFCLIIFLGSSWFLYRSGRNTKYRNNVAKRFRNVSLISAIIFILTSFYWMLMMIVSYWSTVGTIMFSFGIIAPFLAAGLVVIGFLINNRQQAPDVAEKEADFKITDCLTALFGGFLYILLTVYIIMDFYSFDDVGRMVLLILLTYSLAITALTYLGVYYIFLNPNIALKILIITTIAGANPFIFLTVRLIRKKLKEQ